MSMDMLASTVRDRTTISARYRYCAAYQSMDVYLADWQAARNRLDRQIRELEEMRDERKAEQESGAWPYPEPYERTDR